MKNKVIIEKNSNNVWTAVITFVGFPSIGKAFNKKEDAENWVKEMTQTWIDGLDDEIWS